MNKHLDIPLAVDKMKVAWELLVDNSFVALKDSIEDIQPKLLFCHLGPQSLPLEQVFLFRTFWKKRTSAAVQNSANPPQVVDMEDNNQEDTGQDTLVVDILRETWSKEMAAWMSIQVGDSIEEDILVEDTSEKTVEAKLQLAFQNQILKLLTEVARVKTIGGLEKVLENREKEAYLEGKFQVKVMTFHPQLELMIQKIYLVHQSK